MYRTAPLIRPDWTPATIALMVLGFIVFWPLGLAMLAYILFGDRLHAFKREANDKMDGFYKSCRRGGCGSRRVRPVAGASGSRGRTPRHPTASATSRWSFRSPDP